MVAAVFTVPDEFVYCHGSSSELSRPISTALDETITAQTMSESITTSVKTFRIFFITFKPP
jgi:hypothetical protein